MLVCLNRSSPVLEHEALKRIDQLRRTRYLDPACQLSIVICPLFTLAIVEGAFKRWVFLALLPVDLFRHLPRFVFGSFLDHQVVW